MAIVTLADAQYVEQVVMKVGNIATLPEVTARIIATVEDPESHAAQLHQIISHDPALVTRILKVVNSAFYGRPGQIASVERAIVLLGLNIVKNIAVAASLGQLFRGVKMCEGYSARDLWNHCIGVGVASRELARTMKLPCVDEAFLAGMIHDVGLLVSLQVFPERLSQACEQARLGQADLCDIENEIMGMDHQRLGATLCQQWKFPRSCQLVAGYHHRPHELDLDERQLVTIVHLADTLCCAAGAGFNLTALRQNPEDSSPAEVGIEPTAIDGLRSALPALIAESASIFG